MNQIEILHQYRVEWALTQLHYVDNAIFYKFYHYNEIITKLV